MLDPLLLRRFKKCSREDEKIAEILVQSLPLERIRTILDVGAGPGVVSRMISQAIPIPVTLTVIEPQVEYTYPSGVKLIRHRWEDVDLTANYDLILMSHVIGHFEREGRGSLVARALDHLSPDGCQVIIENAPVEPYWSLNLDLGKLQNIQYIVDFDELENALVQKGTFRRIERSIPLFLGSTRREQVQLLNVLFPEQFSTKELDMVQACWRELFPKEDGFLNLTQRFYYVHGRKH